MSLRPRQNVDALAERLKHVLSVGASRHSKVTFEAGGAIFKHKVKSKIERLAGTVNAFKLTSNDADLDSERETIGGYKKELEELLEQTNDMDVDARETARGAISIAGGWLKVVQLRKDIVEHVDGIRAKLEATSGEEDPEQRKDMRNQSRAEYFWGLIAIAKRALSERKAFVKSGNFNVLQALDAIFMDVQKLTRDEFRRIEKRIFALVEQEPREEDRKKDDRAKLLQAYLELSFDYELPGDVKFNAFEQFKEGIVDLYRMVESGEAPLRLRLSKAKRDAIKNSFAEDTREMAERRASEVMQDGEESTSRTRQDSGDTTPLSNENLDLVFNTIMDTIIMMRDEAIELQKGPTDALNTKKHLTTTLKLPGVLNAAIIKVYPRGAAGGRTDATPAFTLVFNMPSKRFSDAMKYFGTNIAQLKDKTYLRSKPTIKGFLAWLFTSEFLTEEERLNFFS